MKKDIKKEYSNGELTVIWQPVKCIHAKECIKALPEVYKPEEKPWITPQNASTADLISQIKKCPSGALTYVMKGEQETQVEATSVEVTVTKNGPLLVAGKFRIKDSSGNEKEQEGATAFCRCGVSNNKPFCDGSHNSSGFKG
ncbi:MAG: (4Fe-4S)-binding protein [Maribacter sp.]